LKYEHFVSASFRAGERNINDDFFTTPKPVPQP